MSGPAKWDWSISNGNASAAATAAAYTALTTGGRTAAFTAPVWNDILAKISAQRVFWTDTAWDAKTPSLANTRMVSGDTMTALRFNTAVKNMPPIKSWPWQSTLGRTDLIKGDRCNGAYFVYLTDGLNYWIDLVPIPVKFSNSAVSTIAVAGHVAPAIHVMVQKPLSSIWTPTVTARVAPSAPVEYDLYVTQSGELTLSTLNVAPVRIVNFAHVDFNNHVSTYPTAHVIAELNATLQHSACVSFGNCVFLEIRLPFTYTASGTVYADQSLPLYADFTAGQFSASAAVGMAQHCYFAFNLISKLQGEPRIRELDSIPFYAALAAVNNISLTVSCQQMDLIVAHLAAVLTGSASVSSAQTVELAILLQSIATVTGQLSTPSNLAFSIHENAGTLRVLSELYGATGSAFQTALAGLFAGHGELNTLSARLVKAAVNSTSAAALSLTTKTAARIITAILCQSNISTNIDELQAAHVMAALAGDLSLSADAGVLVRQLVKTSLYDAFDVTARADVMTGAPTGANLADLVAISAAVQALGRCYTGADVVIQSAITAAARCPNLLHSGADLLSALVFNAAVGVKAMETTGALVSGTFGLMAQSVLSAPESMEAHIQNLSTISATAITSLVPQSMSFILSGQSDFTASVIVPAEVLGVLASLSVEFDGNAQIQLINRIAVYASAIFQHTGSTDVKLATVYAILATVTGQHSGAMTVSSVVALAFKGELQMVHTVTTSLTLMTLTLVSELEDVLVSDLDDDLVTDVEFSIR